MLTYAMKINLLTSNKLKLYSPNEQLNNISPNTITEC